MKQAGTVTGQLSTTGITPLNPKLQNYYEQTGVDKNQPLFCWQLAGRGRKQKQTAYQVIVADNLAAINENRGNMYDSGKVLSNSQSNVQYQGALLQSSTKYFWKLRVWDEKGLRSSWSEINTFITGIMDHDNWTAKWIGNGSAKPFYARKTFTIKKKLKMLMPI